MAKFHAGKDGAAAKDHAGRTIDFGRTATDYAQHRPGFPAKTFDLWAAREWLNTHQSALDLGTGTGSIAIELAVRGLAATGLDRSAAMLDAAKKSAEALHVHVDFVEGTAEVLPFPDQSFDLVTAGQCWWWFDENKTLAEVQRVLKPGGRIIIAGFCYIPMHGNVAGRTEDLILKHNPGWSAAGCIGVFPEQIQALTRAEFHDVESFSYDVLVPFSHEAWRGRMRACNGVAATLTEEQVRAFDRDLVDMLVQEVPAEPLQILHRVFVVSGVISNNI